MALDQAKLAVVKATLRKDADSSGYGRFVTDDWINKLAQDVVTAIQNLDAAAASGKTL